MKRRLVKWWVRRQVAQPLAACDRYLKALTAFDLDEIDTATFGTLQDLCENARRAAIALEPLPREGATETDLFERSVPVGSPEWSEIELRALREACRELSVATQKAMIYGSTVPHSVRREVLAAYASFVYGLLHARAFAELAGLPVVDLPKMLTKVQAELEVPAASPSDPVPES